MLRKSKEQMYNKAILLICLVYHKLRYFYRMQLYTIFNFN